ncbi:uncharacterized protein LOC143619131 [Bidens hawaiensis]|uniref:uncharacterized protein LOC143619131 n=1 Tax=Bidens hawaiensis TaxID=980011 RepID=UPI0040497D79
MGNYTSTCSLMMITPLMKTIKAARVILPSGKVRQLRELVNAVEIMLESPGFFLVNARALTINRRFSPLSADEDLEPGNVFIMFPMRRVNSVVTPADMAVFGWPEIALGNGFPGRRWAVEERPRVAVEVPEFGYRVAVCRSRKPSLDTIIEEPIFSNKVLLEA